MSVNAVHAYSQICNNLDLALKGIATTLRYTYSYGVTAKTIGAKDTLL